MGAVLSVVGTVFLVIFKIILVLLLLLGFLLLCPACYKVKADYHGVFLAEGRVIWILGLFYLSFAYKDGGMESRIRLFGVDLKKLLSRMARRREKRAAKKTDKEDVSSFEQQEKFQEEDDSDSTGVEIKTFKSRQDSDSTEQEDLRMAQLDVELPDEKMFAEETFDEDFPDEKMSGESERLSNDEEMFWHSSFFSGLRQRVAGFFRSIRQFFVSIRSIYRKIKKKCEWAGEAKIFWQSENTQRMVCILKDNVLHLWRKLKPKVLRGYIVFGAGDPCTTGQALGVAAILYAYYGKGIQVTPDFEEKRLEGNLLAKGRISIITILIILFRVFLSGEWSQFRQEAKQLKEAL